MRRLPVLILTILISLTFIGCGDDPASKTKTDDKKDAKADTDTSKAKQDGKADDDKKVDNAKADDGKADDKKDAKPDNGNGSQTNTNHNTTSTNNGNSSTPEVKADNTTAGTATDAASTVKPLPVGSGVPNVPVLTSGGTRVGLVDVVGTAPTVLVFYRGGWCPICNRHLKELVLSHAELKTAGYQLVAISVDAPVNAEATVLGHNLPYLVLADPEAEATKAFGLAFKVDDETVTALAKRNMDLEAASGQTHHILPVPAVFIIRDREIKFRHFDPNYAKRLDAQRIIDEAKIAAVAE